MNQKSRMPVLAGDIGGTKTNLALFQEWAKRPIPKVVETYSSPEASSLEQIIEQFLKRHPVSVRSACFGIAGPVHKGRTRTTNLPWKVSENGIKKRFNWETVRLINDLAATALAIPVLDRREMLSLNRVKAVKGGNIGLIAPGTGLGMALLVGGEAGPVIPVSSEGGHADFAPNNESEMALWLYLHRRWRHVSIETLLSGAGLFNIYSWLKDSVRYREPKWLAEALKKDDPAKVISEAARDRRQPLCRSAMDIFVSIFGAAAGNLALTGMTSGGIYLGGGISPRILPHLKEGGFMEAFNSKGRFKDWMVKIPVRVILNDRAALIGAACCAAGIDSHLTGHKL